MTSELSPFSHEIWDMKYRLRAADGEPIDGTIRDTWRRVADDLAQAEAEPDVWAGRFYEALEAFRFIPAGRILAGAGTERQVTLFNCFVMGTIPDDMAGIFENLKEAALTLQQGGGIGYDFSTLRPRGALVRGVGADASGPVSFMKVWDAMCRTIMSAGSRRGAMMATLSCDHPDIEDFVEAKRDPAALRMFNLSVLVSDAFMEAVEAEADWPLVFAGETYKTLPARGLWKRIMRATYEVAEPGVIFIDRINRRNNLHYCEEIRATNPCVTAETWVQTAEGPRRVSDLVGRRFTALVDGRAFESGPAGFFPTGRKPVLRLSTVEGPSLRLTADHPVRKVVERTSWSTRSDWVRAGDLEPGDEILLHDHRAAADWLADPGVAEVSTPEAGYLLGLLVGDGTIKQEAAVLSAWPGALAANGGSERPGVTGVMRAAEAAARTLRHRSDFAGWTEVRGCGEYRLKLAALREIALAFGLAPGRKAITPDIEMGPAAFSRAFLRGLFDADGSVQGTQAKGVSVRLAQSDLGCLESVQRMLLRLGIVSTLYRERGPAGERLLPDGKGGRSAYWTSADHELVIANESLARFAEFVGFEDTEKAARLATALGSYRRAPNRERFVARVAEIVLDGEEEVFDVQVPGANAFDANGLVVHNCGEQPLPPYGACLLGSINLASLVERPFEAEAALDLEALDRLTRVAVRMLDNAIDRSRFPLPQQKAEAEAKRRIGLGVTGLADALILCGAVYGSAEAVRLTEIWMAAIRRSAYLASAELAAEKGTFPLYEKEAFLAGENVRELEPEVREAIARHGLRNGLVTSVAPTGTISLIADNVSSGLEPVFSFTYRRNVLLPDGSRKTETVSDHAYRLFRRLKGPDAALPEAFVDAQSLPPEAHLLMQATVQRFIDAAVSKTINLPETISFEDFERVYLRAYALGCKGCTTYRPNEVTGAVLSLEPDEPAGAATAAPPSPAERPPAAEAGEGVVYMMQPLERPGALAGATYKLRWPESDHALYITINDIEQDGRRRPFEIFINSKNMEHYAWTVALTRMISAVFRRGGDVSFVVEELKAVFDPRGGAWQNGRYIPSLLAAIGEVIERHLREIGFLAAPDEGETQGLLPLAAPRTAAAEGAAPTADGGAEIKAARTCPRCGYPMLVRSEGCDTCLNCAFTRCL